MGSTSFWYLRLREVLRGTLGANLSTLPPSTLAVNIVWLPEERGDTNMSGML